MKPTILVYGWYNRGNVGDDLFVSAFKKLFPDYDLIFTDHINLNLLQGVSAVFFGGGSFLYAEPDISDDAREQLAHTAICYIGVGTETQIHPRHQELMRQAKLIATRSPERLEFIKQINSETMYVPDIVYALQDEVGGISKLSKSILIMPSFEVVPRWDGPNWMSASWEYFKSEFAQTLDALYESGFNLHFFSMCANKKIDDNWAATEIINKMHHRSNEYLVRAKPKGIGSVTKLISQFELIVTQRYHGIVLSEMTRVPYLAIHHHDKIKNSYPHEGRSLSYYGATKANLLQEINAARYMNFTNVLPIDSDIFEVLKEKVSGIINGR